MRGYLIDVVNDKAREVEIADGNHLKQFYDLIGCDCIDIAVRTVGGKPYNVVLDDEGLLVADPIASAVDANYHAMLAGNLLIFGIGADMDLVGITKEDVGNIQSNCREVIDFDRMTMHPVIIMGY